MIKAEEAKKIAKEVNDLEYELELIGKEIEKAARQGRYVCNIKVRISISLGICNLLRREKYTVFVPTVLNENFIELRVSW